jgi:hypothetical protein
MEPETDDLPAVDGGDDNAPPRDPDVAVRSNAGDDDGSDDSAIGYQ